MDLLAANPIVLVIAGIAALAIGLYEAYEHCKPFRDAVNEVGAVLGGALSAAFNAVSEVAHFFGMTFSSRLASSSLSFCQFVFEAIGGSLERLEHSPAVDLAQCFGARG